MNPSQDWKAKLESAYSLMVQNCKNTVWTVRGRQQCLPHSVVQLAPITQMGVAHAFQHRAPQDFIK